MLKCTVLHKLSSLDGQCLSFAELKMFPVLLCNVPDVKGVCSDGSCRVSTLITVYLLWFVCSMSKLPLVCLQMPLHPLCTEQAEFSQSVKSMLQPLFRVSLNVRPHHDAKANN